MFAGTTTSEPAGTSAARIASSSASVPLPTPMQCLMPRYSAISRSNSITAGPLMNAPLDISAVMPAVTSSATSSCCHDRSTRGIGAPRRSRSTSGASVLITVRSSMAIDRRRSTRSTVRSPSVAFTVRTTDAASTESPGTPRSGDSRRTRRHAQDAVSRQHLDPTSRARDPHDTSWNATFPATRLRRRFPLIDPDPLESEPRVRPRERRGERTEQTVDALRRFRPVDLAIVGDAGAGVGRAGPRPAPARGRLRSLVPPHRRGCAAGSRSVARRAPSPSSSIRSRRSPAPGCRQRRAQEPIDGSRWLPPVRRSGSPS